MSGIGEKTLSIRILNSSNHVVTSNYAVTNPTCTFEILKATLTITPTKLWKTYGEEDGVLTYLVSGLKKNDTTQVINGVLARDLGEVVDTYEFSVNNLSADHYNFVLVQNAPKFEIRKKSITVTYNLLDSYTYGDTITKAPTVSEGLLLGHTIVIEDDLSNAGTYVINPHIYDSLNNNVTSNYLITNNGFVLVINTKELIITSESKSKYYGEDDPLIGYTVSGYVNGESNLVMGNISRVEGELAGSYNILIDSLDLQSTNYHLTLVPNTFTINQKSISFTFNSNTYIYQGKVFNIVLSSTELLPTDTITILNNTFVDAGTYQLQVKITNGLVDVTSSYLINNDSLVFTITPKVIGSVLWSYDNILATATSPDLVLGEEFSYENKR
ncbi:MAG TPA: hypothetical protein GXX66_04765 [Acholeplasmataceae bacterium]|nr:hypothetical protein [Acholeplasmataceae bacterium]